MAAQLGRLTSFQRAKACSKRPCHPPVAWLASFKLRPVTRGWFPEHTGLTRGRPTAQGETW